MQHVISTFRMRDYWVEDILDHTINIEFYDIPDNSPLLLIHNTNQDLIDDIMLAVQDEDLY